MHAKAAPDLAPTENNSGPSNDFSRETNDSDSRPRRIRRVQNVRSQPCRSPGKRPCGRVTQTSDASYKQRREWESRPKDSFERTARPRRDRNPFRGLEHRMESQAIRQLDVRRKRHQASSNVTAKGRRFRPHLYRAADSTA